MVIGIDASRAFRQHRTGVEEYAYQLLRAMAPTTPDAVQVRLYIQSLSPRAESRGLGASSEIPRRSIASATGGSSRGGRDDKIDWLPSSWELRVLRWPTRLWTHTALAWELFRNPPDVYFEPARVLPVTSYQLPVTKFVITIHDVGFRRIPWAYSPFDRWYQHTMTKYEVRRKKYEVQIIVPSEFTKRELVELYHVNPHRIIVIAHATTYNTPTSYKLSSRSPEGRQATSSFDPCGFPYILSIGRIEKKKNTLGMIKAFERGEFLKTDNLQHTTTHYMLIGPDGYGADEVYRYLADRPDLQARVHILGFVSEQRKWQLLAGARALLHLSHYEGFGLPIAEARALGVPVLTSYELHGTKYEQNRTWTDVARETWQVVMGTVNSNW